MPLIKTDTSSHRGPESEGVRKFLGIPFAEPPVRELRFRPPVRVGFCEATDATRFRPAALQNPDKLDYIWGGYPIPAQEDCLTLNIWTKDIAAGPRPVMVWLHGGAFVIGSGSEFWYEGSCLARHGVVVVTINYRLGAFGFLNLSKIGGSEYAKSANVGLLDQVAALGWIRDNIAKFGGDPDNVTVFGESAGGISICCLLAMPAARGLFRRAIVQSGGPNLVRSRELSLKVADTFLDLSGVRDIEGLIRMPVPQMLATQARLLKSNTLGGDTVFGPVVDGDTLRDWPLDAIGRGDARDVALLIGTTKNEAHLWALYDPILWWSQPTALRRWLGTVAPSQEEVILLAYRAAMPNATGGQQTLAVIGDALFRIPLIRLAEAQLQHRTDTRMYLFSWPSPVGGGIGSPHAIELPFVFGNLHAPGVVNLTGPGEERERLSGIVQSAWVAFATSGNPEHQELPAWPEYDHQTRATMVLDVACRVESDPLGRERGAWRSVPLDGRNPPLSMLPRSQDFILSVLTRPLVLLVGILLVVLLVAFRSWLAN